MWLPEKPFSRISVQSGLSKIQIIHTCDIDGVHKSYILSSLFATETVTIQARKLGKDKENELRSLYINV